MYISWYGESCFKIQNSDKTILIDPEAPRKVGLRGPNFKSDILLLSSKDGEKVRPKSDLKSDSDSRSENQAIFLIEGPGEYEIKGVFIEGIPFEKEKKQTVIYRIIFEEIIFGFLGAEVDSLNDEQIEKIGVVDVLFIPVKERVEEIINSIEPRIVIPHSYQISGLKVKRETIEKFLKKLGKKNIEALEKFSLNKKTLSGEFKQEEIIILKPKV